MPTKALKPCAKRGCAALVRSGFCSLHQAEYEKERGSPSSRGYGREWRKLRDRYLREHPGCEDPHGVHGFDFVAATDVDHIIPLRDGGTNDMSNLQALCHECHSRKTALENNRWGRGLKKLER